MKELTSHILINKLFDVSRVKLHRGVERVLTFDVAHLGHRSLYPRRQCHVATPKHPRERQERGHAKSPSHLQPRPRLAPRLHIIQHRPKPMRIDDEFLEVLSADERSYEIC